MADNDITTELSDKERQQKIVDIFNEIIKAANEGIFTSTDPNTVLIAFDDADPLAVDKLTLAEIFADNEDLYQQFKEASEQKRKMKEAIDSGSGTFRVMRNRRKPQTT